MSQPTPCRSCGAPLAPDQRYCLACGTRVAAPRLDFVAETERFAAADAAAGASAPPAPAAAAAEPRPSRMDRVGGPMGVAAVLLVALGVGFLIGRGGEPAPVVQRAPVVNIQGGLPAGSSAGAATTPVAGDDGGSDADSGASRSRRSSSSERSTRGISKAPPRRTGGDINRLRAEPETTATPGAPPPKDDEPAGGGTDALQIG